MSSYSDFANASSDILLKKGDLLGRTKQENATIWGNTVANLGQVIPQQVQDVMQAAAAKKKEAQIGQIFQQSGGDLEKAIPEVMKIDRDLGLKLTKEHHEAKKLAFEMQELDWKYKTQKAEMADRMLGQVVDDDSWGRYVLAQKAIGADVSGMPDHYDAGFVRQRKIAHLPILEQLKLEAPKDPGKLERVDTVNEEGIPGTRFVDPQANAFYPKAPTTTAADKLPTSVEALRTIAANAKDPRQAEAAAILENLPESVRITGPEMDERYRKIMAKPSKARTGDEVSWASAYERQKAVSQPAVVIQTEQGPGVLDRKSRTVEPITRADTGETVLSPPTQQQALDATFAKRLEDGGKVMTKLTPSITKMNLASFEAQRRLPPAAQSYEMQQYMQAARNVINAVLRRESGAAIRDSEFDDARKQYLAVPGDGPDVLAQKAQNLERQRQGLIKGAGTAYTPDKPQRKNPF